MLWETTLDGKGAGFISADVPPLVLILSFLLVGSSLPTPASEKTDAMVSALHSAAAPSCSHLQGHACIDMCEVSG